ncbi:hypothetical protein [Chryseobacterium herbae]|uniref:Lipoprotein n=1 Tax=Chryseobacterium herbae TaxID=2976476 RepID=A0ABT2J048_9FLAO|nr:hypothetical protein [Chryseobacterium sp. pc1-10]MCT2563935.1 hypothetical protein [Chryseobacterium sp. pc1-10]
MYLNKIYFPLLLATIGISCSPNEKTTLKNKKINDTVHTHHIAEKKEKETPVIDKKESIIDADAVLVAFNKAIRTDVFSKELDFNYKNKLDGSIFDLERPILIGDLNDDHLDDAMMPFSIEGREGGNNWDAYYAVFINNGGVLEYQYSFSRGGDLSETLINFTSIKDGFIKGMEVPGNNSSKEESTPVDYMYRNTDLSEVATASE